MHKFTVLKKRVLLLIIIPILLLLLYVVFLLNGYSTFGGKTLKGEFLLKNGNTLEIPNASVMVKHLGFGESLLGFTTLRGQEYVKEFFEDYIQNLTKIDRENKYYLWFYDSETDLYIRGWKTESGEIDMKNFLDITSSGIFTSYSLQLQTGEEYERGY